MLSLDLIELADLATPDKIVAAILNQNPDIPVPIPIEELAKLSGISSIQPLTSEGFEGALVTNDEKSEGAIFYSARSPATRQRFTIGHELGHFLLPWHRRAKFQCTSADMTAAGSPADWEVQANQFSAGMLLPKLQVKRRMKQLGEPDLEHVELLSAEYQMSLEATARRYVDLNDFPCAVVFSKDNLVRYFIRSEGFTYWLNVKNGSALPSGSPSRNSNGDTADWDEVDSSWWLSEARDGSSQPEYLQEQTLKQQDGYKVILLCAEEIEEDE